MSRAGISRPLTPPAPHRPRSATTRPPQRAPDNTGGMAVADLEGYYKQVHEATIRSAYCGFDVRASTCPAAPVAPHESRQLRLSRGTNRAPRRPNGRRATGGTTFGAVRGGDGAPRRSEGVRSMMTFERMVRARLRGAIGDRASSVRSGSTTTSGSTRAAARRAPRCSTTRRSARSRSTARSRHRGCSTACGSKCASPRGVFCLTTHPACVSNNVGCRRLDRRCKTNCVTSRPLDRRCNCCV